jgi:helix-turn-helix protein
MMPLELRRMMLTYEKDFYLVRSVRIDNEEEAASSAAKEFYISRWRAYKWLKRFDESGLDGLKDLALYHGSENTLFPVLYYLVSFFLPYPQ